MANTRLVPVFFLNRRSRVKSLMIPYVREMTFEYGASDQVSPLIRRTTSPIRCPYVLVW